MATNVYNVVFYIESHNDEITQTKKGGFNLL